MFPVNLFSHSLTLIGGVDNLSYNEDNTQAIETIDSYYKILGSLSVDGHIAENVTYNLSGGLDAVWKYYMSGEALFRFSLVKIGLGTFFQYSFEGKDFLYPGASLALGLEIPGAFWAEAKTVVMFYEHLKKIGNIGFSYLYLGAGYWTEHLIAGFCYDRKEYAEARSNSAVVRDLRERYYFHTEINDKNRPWTIEINVGWQTILREIDDIPAQILMDDTIQTLFVDLDFLIRFSRAFTLVLKGGIPIPLFHPHSKNFWFNAYTGFILNAAD